MLIINSLVFIPRLIIQSHYMNSNYGFGRRVERLVAATLAIFGWSCVLSPGSRGPIDIFSTRSRIRWCHQVKYRDSTFSLDCINGDLTRIMRHSSLHNCTPILAFVSSIIPTYSMGGMKSDANFSNVIRYNDGSMYGIKMGTLLLQLYDLEHYVMLDPLRKVNGAN